MTVLVTGGAGFIGSNFISYWIKKYPKDRIVCLDALTYAGNLSALDSVTDLPNFRFVKGNICNVEEVEILFASEQPDVVVHFAAESHVDRSIEDPSVFLNTNVIGTQVLLEACKRHGNIRFHQISTDEVYGDVPLEEKQALFTEQSILKPSSPYAASKASADLLVLSYFRTYDLPVTVSRCSNNYGPHQFPEKLIPCMVKHAKEDKPMPVYGTGENMRDWLYVLDHCRAIDLIVRKGTVGSVYNVCANHEISNIDLVKKICKILQKPESLIVYVADRKGHDLRYAVDCSKLKRELQWEPKMRFEEAFEKTVLWYFEQP